MNTVKRCANCAFFVAAGKVDRNVYPMATTAPRNLCWRMPPATDAWAAVHQDARCGEWTDAPVTRDQIAAAREALMARAD